MDIYIYILKSNSTLNALLPTNYITTIVKILIFILHLSPNNIFQIIPIFALHILNCVKNLVQFSEIYYY